MNPLKAKKNSTVLSSPNRIVQAGVFSFARCSDEILDTKTVTTHKITHNNVHMNRNAVLRKDASMSSSASKRNYLFPPPLKTSPVKHASRPLSASAAAPRPNTNSNTPKPDDNSIQSVPDSNASSVSTARKSAAELENILIEKQLKLQRLSTELEKVSSTCLTLLILTSAAAQYC